MDQAVLERTIEELLVREYGVHVQYSTECLSLNVREHGEIWPVIVEWRPRRPDSPLVTSDDGSRRVLRAKYLVGADGARSWTRSQVGIRMQGSRSSQCWGVLDFVPLSNFPDMRNRCIIHKQDCGTVMTIPRESGMVRVYVQLGEDTSVQPPENQPTDTYILEVTRRIMAPYQLHYHKCHWSSIYRVEQKIASSFSAFDRVFLLGDAIHTHSPKAGQGLNVSLQDAYNLGWKLAAVVRGQAKPRILTTYEKERRPVAQFLLDFDRDFQRFFHEPLTNQGWTPEQYRRALSEAVNVEHDQLSGISATFIDDHMTSDSRYVRSDLAAGVEIGKRIGDATVVNQADGRHWEVRSLLISNGKWRLLVFAGDIRVESLMKRYVRLGQELDREAFSNPQIWAQVDVVTVHASPRLDIDLLQLPAAFHPWSDVNGWDYDKVFADDDTYHSAHSRAYKVLGICDSAGAALLLRPDSHVCMIMEVQEATHSATAYLSNWLYSSTVEMDEQTHLPEQKNQGRAWGANL